MRSTYKFIIIVLIIACLAANSHITAKGEEVQEVVPETLAVSLVIDTSGSMAITDPQKLRETAANIFIDLLSPEDYLGIITFDTAPVIVQSLQKVNDSAGKTMFKQNLAPYIGANGDTNYKTALDEAYNQLAGLQDSSVRKVIVFITDGEPDPDMRRNSEPGFMDNYMAELWGTVQNLAVNKFPVYSVGFSDGIRADVLSRIAADTGGDFKILSDPGALAVSFFDILGDLKNRKSFINQSLDLHADSGIGITLDEYTSQSTIVIVNREGSIYDAEVVNPKGEVNNGAVSINKTDKYTIIILNNKDNTAYGEWRLNLRGSGTVDIFGDRDLNIKSWLVSPLVSRQHPVNEPVDIEVNVTGEMKGGVSVAAYVKGVNEAEPQEIILENVDGVFKGVYEKTETPGAYSIEVKVLLNNEVLTSTQEEFQVSVLPVLKNDFSIKEEGYRIGESISIRSNLEMEGVLLKQGADLAISNFSLLINHEDGTSEQIALSDDGQGANRDMEAGDGVWSGVIAFTKETVAKASLIVTGTYKDKSFVLENDIGKFKALQPGNIEIDINDKNLIGIVGKTVSIPLTIRNDSAFAENLYVRLDESIGTLVHERISLEPGKEKKTEIKIILDKEVKEGIQTVNIGFDAENEMTAVSMGSFSSEVEILSEFQGRIREFQNFLNGLRQYLTLPVVIILSVVMLLLVGFIAGGIILYRRIYLEAKKIRGLMEYQPKDGHPLGEISNKFNFERMDKKKITITFDEKKKDTDYRIKGTEYKYDLVISSELKKPGCAVITGWKTLFRKSVPVTYRISATVPGIIEKNGMILTTKVLEENDEFESGGYVFRYSMPESKWIKNRTDGKNILEGKYEDGQSI